jgi:hypothetical protein
MLPGVIQQVHPLVFDQISGYTIQKATSRTEGGAGPSGMNADDWSRILATNKYERISENVAPEAMSSLEAFISCLLIPLNKNPGCRPIGIGEILRGLSAKPQ